MTDNTRLSLSGQSVDDSDATPDPIARSRGTDPWPQPPGPEDCSLSIADREVLCLLAQHLNNLEIAGRLMTSVLAARLLVHDVLDKLGAADVSEAVARARELGLVTGGGPQPNLPRPAHESPPAKGTRPD